MPVATRVVLPLIAMSESILARSSCRGAKRANQYGWAVHAHPLQACERDMKSSTTTSPVVPLAFLPSGHAIEIVFDMASEFGTDLTRSPSVRG